MRNWVSTLLIVVAANVGTPAWSQEKWPIKPVEFVSTGSPGSASDIHVNILKDDLQQALGQPVVLINKPGAGAQIGGLYVARSRPDGHTVLVTHTALQATGPSIYKDLKYDPVNDLAAVARISQAPSILFVLKDSPIKDVADLIARARNQPGRLTYASTGIGTVEHLSAVLLANAASLDVVHVPYQGTAAALQGMLAGEADFAFTNPSVVGEHIRSGRVRALAVASETRQTSFPEIPTLKELGLDVIAESWYGFAVAANTPKPIIEKLASMLLDAMSKPAARERIMSLGLVYAPQGAEDFDRYIKQEYSKWKPLIEAAGAATR